MLYRNLIDSLDDIEDLNSLKIRNFRPTRERPQARSPKKQKAKPVSAEPLALDHEDMIDHYQFTYNASRHEREWILNSLTDFFDQQWFADVLRLIKGGKEASVYQCLAMPSLGAPYIAAKIYRPRRFRNLKNDHIYREGRENLDEDGNIIREDGLLHAIQKRTEFGLHLLHTSWIEHEVQTLKILYEAGADVPVPYASGDNAILMSYIGEDDLSAPTLNTVTLEPEEARPLFERVVKNIELMLANNRVHGDLSAYNILYWEGSLTLIDFPQAIEPGVNLNAYRIFERDVTRICDYFSRQGLTLSPHRLAADMWTAYGFRLTPDIHPRLLDDQDEAHIAYWRSQQGD